MDVLTVTEFMHSQFSAGARFVFFVKDGKRILDTRREWLQFLDYLEARLLADVLGAFGERVKDHMENARRYAGGSGPQDELSARLFHKFESHPTTLAAYRKFRSQ